MDNKQLLCTSCKNIKNFDIIQETKQVKPYKKAFNAIWLVCAIALFIAIIELLVISLAVSREDFIALFLLRYMNFLSDEVIKFAAGATFCKYLFLFSISGGFITLIARFLQPYQNITITTMICKDCGNVFTYSNSDKEEELKKLLSRAEKLMNK